MTDRQKRRKQHLAGNGPPAREIERQCGTVENPMTATGAGLAASSSKADSTAADQSCQVEAGMSGPGPSWPGKSGEPRNPSAFKAAMSGSSS